MKDLAYAMCTTKEEKIRHADIMAQTGIKHFEAEVVNIYYEVGEEDRCMEYLGNDFGRKK